MGEVVRLTERRLELRLVAVDGKGDVSPAAPGGLLIRDAGRDGDGLLTTAEGRRKPAAIPPVPEEMLPPAGGETVASPPVSTRVGSAWATLVGGVMGDPLLHVRLRHRKLSLLFDLGETAGLSPRAAHQVRAVFLSHAHLDHIAGFLWFLRARIGLFGPCKIFGPPGTIDSIESFLNAITWDRIEANGPLFEVSDIIGDRLHSARLQAGRPRVDGVDRPVAEGVVFYADTFRVKAVTCDHGIPSMAYALSFDREINVRKERLVERGWAAGPWLGRLKNCIAQGAMSAPITLPDGTRQTTAALAEVLTIIRPGKKLVYAADMADTPANRDALTALATGAHTLFCETAFTAADGEKAAATQHLTTTATVEIARAAGVDRLVPFHFSKRYEKDPARLYRELRSLAGSVKIIGRL
jgi:ribonuclease BN (tRNA processing enzyme)